MKALLFLIALPLLAQEAPKPPALPQLTTEQQRDYLANQLALERAAAEVKSLQQAHDEIVRSITATCGESGQPSLDAKGIPHCIEKPTK